MLKHFKVLLEAVTAHPACRLIDIPLQQDGGGNFLAERDNFSHLETEQFDFSGEGQR
jgi:hypothetical protein